MKTPKPRWWGSELRNISQMLIILALVAISTATVVKKAREADTIERKIKACTLTIATGEKKLAEAFVSIPKDSLGKRLATREELEIFLDAIIGAARKSKELELISLEALGNTTSKTHLAWEAGRIVDIPIRIVTSGKYFDTMTFLKNMDKIAYVTQTDSIVIVGNSTKAPQSFVSLTLVIKVFVYEMLTNPS